MTRYKTNNLTSPRSEKRKIGLCLSPRTRRKWSSCQRRSIHHQQPPVPGKQVICVQVNVRIVTQGNEESRGAGQEDWRPNTAAQLHSPPETGRDQYSLVETRRDQYSSVETRRDQYRPGETSTVPQRPVGERNQYNNASK